MKICDAKRVGFYISRNGTIYEVLKNTNKRWLKEEPEAKLILDIWVYKSTENGKKIYKTFDKCYHYLSEFGDYVTKCKQSYHLIKNGDYMQED